VSSAMRNVTFILKMAYIILIIKWGLMTRIEALTWCIRCYRFLAGWTSGSVSGAFQVTQRGPKEWIATL
jgi:hypothetical protein